MSQNYRIYINDNTLTIGKSAADLPEMGQHLDLQKFDFPTFCKSQMAQKGQHFFIASDDAKADFDSIRASCNYIRAAGGLVQNDEGAYLFIYRNNKWDLPKGKLDPDERSRVAAAREVEEECGVTVHETGERICKTYHVYYWDGVLTLKRTSWYQMRVRGQNEPRPQAEEGITKVEWVLPEELPEKRVNTYPLIKEVLKRAGL